ncbi:CRE-PTR-4 protein [Aphelenchoides avenae]|nr:CRE-PTR-4 protein [Aphelenchus avenae]
MPLPTFEEIGEKLSVLTVLAFEKYGEFVGRHPGKVLIATLIATALCAPGLGFIRINLDLYKLFVPLDAPVRFEFESQQAYDRIPLGNLDAEPPPAKRTMR